ncbi:MAG: tetratricopeptide repeat protein [Acidobacteria bacterium]|nr:tetratricopeptide repeat protein [Acidobacteriota bacterium]
MMEEKPYTSYEFGPFRLLPFERLLLRDDRPVALAPRVFDTLLVFVQNSGRLLSKDELMQLVWGERIVEESNLTQNIFILRKLLGETPHDHHYLVTIPLHGYRFVAQVRKSHEGHGSAGAENYVAQADPARRGATAIAVLPFTVLGSPSSEPFEGIGIADTLITKLSKLKQLIVRPVTAVLKYAEMGQDLLAIGAELQVAAVLEGSLQRAGDRLRVNARLVQLNSGATLWADKFDDKFTDIFAVQDLIAVHIAQALELELSVEERRHLAQSHTTNLEAYQLYIKGRYFWDSRTEQGLFKGIEYAERVTELDADDALAYVGLADSYALLGEYLYLSPQAAFPKAKAAAERALKLDPSNAQAHASLGEVAFFYEWDWRAAERHYLKSIAIDPHYASAHHWYAWFLMAMGRLDEAGASITQAQRLDPGSLTLNTVLGLPFYYGRRYEMAVEQYRETLEMNPDFAQARYCLASALTHLGQYDEAIAEYQQVRPLYEQQAASLQAFTYAVAGQPEKARGVLEELRRLSEQRYVSPYLEAIIHTGLGDAESALLKLEEAFQERAAWMVFLNVDPFLERLRPEPSFAGLLQRVGFSA